MCSQMDDPTQHDKVTRPRVYELSGQGPRGSVALAVIGQYLNAAEYALDEHQGAWSNLAYEVAVTRVDVLRGIRDAVAEAEQLTRVGYLR